MKYFLIVLVLAAMAGGVYYAFFLDKPTPDVKITFEKPGEVMVGQPFVLKIKYSNESPDTLKDAKLSVSLPDNVSILGDSDSHRVDQISLGDIESRVSASRDEQLIVMDDPQTVKRIEVRISYSLKGASSGFENQAKVDVVVGDPAINLSVDTPDKVLSGEEFEIKINYRNNTDQDYKDSKIRIDYPPAYSFSNSEPSPVSGKKNEWNLGVLAPRSEGVISVKGTALGQEGLTLNYGINFISQFLGQSYTLQRQITSIEMAKPTLSLSLKVNDDANYIAKIGDTLRYSLKFRNNSSVTLQNITLKASLTGGLFDISSVRTDGSLNSINNTIVWTAGTSPYLQSISPGEEKEAQIEIRLADSFPIRRLSDKNYSLKILVNIESPTVPSGINAQKTVSSSKIETKVQGMAEFISQAFRYDTSLGAQNTGPYPPRINQKTQYTVHWSVKNYSTDISSVKVVAYLRPGTVFTGKIGKTDYPVVYDSKTGKITWEVSRIPATVGVLGAPQEVIFQIENTPAANQLDQNVELVSAAEFSAKDDFTGVGLSAAAPPITTAIMNDPKVTVDDRRVRP